MTDDFKEMILSEMSSAINDGNAHHVPIKNSPNNLKLFFGGTWIDIIHNNSDLSMCVETWHRPAPTLDFYFHTPFDIALAAAASEMFKVAVDIMEVLSE